MRLLRHLRKITALANAHRNLSIRAFHVLMHRFSQLLRLAVHSLQHFFEAVVDRVDIVLTTVLHWQTLTENCNAGRLPELLLVANLA